MNKNNLKRKVTRRFLLVLFFLPMSISLVYGKEESTKKNIFKQSFGQSALKIVPQRCVALREGQICYQNIVISWSTKISGHYCIYTAKTKESLKCWDNKKQGSFETDFQSTQTTQFILKDKNKQIEVAKGEIIVAWVYGNKKRRRTSWRLF